MKPINRIRRNRSSEGGTQIVEFALMLPLLLFLALLVSEGASFVQIHQVLNNAAREGAHFSAMPENKDVSTVVQQVVRDYGQNNGLDPTKMTVTPNQITTVTSSGITLKMSEVLVTYPFQLKYLPAVPFLNTSSTLTLKGSAEFRNFY